MAAEIELSSSIRFVAKFVGWITAFIAPITGIYSYVHSGSLSADGISTQLSIWQVLWNLSINFGYLMLIYGVIFYASVYVIVLPLGLIISAASSDPKKLEDDSFVRKLVIADAVIIFLLTWPLLLGWVGISLDPAKHSAIDGLFGIVGAVYLFSIYCYVYLAATGKLEEKKPAES